MKGLMKVMIDAGHGINTAGKRAPDDSMREHHFNNAVAKYVDIELKKYEKIETAFSHDPTGVRDVPLKERTDKANKWGADCFISIHANALKGTWHTGGGIETYVYITKPAFALKLANNIQSELIKATGLRDRGVKTDDFHVLRETRMTAVLMECGFYDNKEELAFLKSDLYRRKCAIAIVNGIATTYSLKKKPESGWVNVSGKWYFVKKSGGMATGWLEEAGKKYFFDSKGVMQTGWILDAGKWYYLKESGDLLVDATIIIGKDGAMQ